MINNTFRSPLNSLEYFALLVADEAGIPMAEVAVNIAQIEYPKLVPSEIADWLDQHASNICNQIPKGLPVIDVVGAINDYLYNHLQFKGDAHPYSEDISLLCINSALLRRRASDAMMCIVYLEIAQFLGLNACGIVFPEQFLIKIRMYWPNGYPAEIIINPVSGKVLSIEEIRALLEPFKRTHGLIGDYDIPSDLFLKAATSKEIIANLLYKMKLTYQKHSKWSHLVKVLDRLIILQPDFIDNYRERGYAHMRYQQPEKAILDLEHYLQYARIQSVYDAHIVEQELQQLRNSSC